MIKSDYNKEDDIIYVERTGDIGLQDILIYIESYDQKFLFLKNLHIMEDFRPSVSVFKKEEYPIMLKEIKKRMDRYKFIRHAVLVDNPKDTVLSILFELLSDSVDGYSYKTFSTIEAARDWLK